MGARPRPAPGGGRGLGGRRGGGGGSAEPGARSPAGSGLARRPSPCREGRAEAAPPVWGLAGAGARPGSLVNLNVASVQINGEEAEGVGFCRDCVGFP